ncbi:MAG: phytanoyl-CoA dioxygenase family protein [Coxiellaceae bacterium]|nr:phytanoyl-CoA dioxygenase family protein [Coxiellaceae bacterium]
MRDTYVLNEAQKQSWQDHGYLVIRDYFTDQQKQDLQQWTEEMSAWPEQPGKWWKYFEKTDSDSRQLCRIERFYDFHQGWHDLIDAPAIHDVLAELMGERAVLFKEKLNFKLPGGGGFLPHQDAPAFVAYGQDYHITMSVALDVSSTANGCLHVVEGGHHKHGVLQQALDGSVSIDVYKDFNWLPVCCDVGDIVLFDSYIPHYSERNSSNRPRRAAYITYNKASQGDRRADYYHDKLDKFPPECERDPSKDYSKYKHVYNLANPID